ncbi:hypothetical protein OPV22_009857 [Ensete ventricosum]|uniref:Uncharacterized protein n=1 Tax=Ensete ventricosum TaxID=4639 RepID=A0AAV8RC14_ENSVE|nr:hypothetical protein OPV22_009857 [Ensete ventricosum]
MKVAFCGTVKTLGEASDRKAIGTSVVTLRRCSLRLRRPSPIYDLTDNTAVLTSNYIVKLNLGQHPGEELERVEMSSIMLLLLLTSFIQWHALQLYSWGKWSAL